MKPWRRVRAGAYVRSPWSVFRDPAKRGPWFVWKYGEALARSQRFDTAAAARGYCEDR